MRLLFVGSKDIKSPCSPDITTFFYHHHLLIFTLFHLPASTGSTLSFILYTQILHSLSPNYPSTTSSITSSFIPKISIHKSQNEDLSSTTFVSSPPPSLCHCSSYRRNWSQSMLNSNRHLCSWNHRDSNTWHGNWAPIPRCPQIFFRGKCHHERCSLRSRRTGILERRRSYWKQGHVSSLYSLVIHHEGFVTNTSSQGKHGFLSPIQLPKHQASHFRLLPRRSIGAQCGQTTSSRYHR